MNGVLGSLKNMLKKWRINFRKKKKQDEVKIYNRKITKYPRLTSFIYSTIAIIYCPFGYMFAKSNKQASNEQPKLYKKIEKINVKLDEMIVKKENNVKTIEKDILEIKKQIEIPMSKESKNYFTSKLKEIEIKTKFIKNPVKISNLEAKVIKESLENSFVKHKNVNKKLLQSLPISLVLIKQKDDNKKENELKNIQNKPLFIKQANKELKNINEQVQNIETKILNVNQYNHFYDLENELKYLRKRIEKLKEKYKEIKDYLNFEVDYDKYELCKSPKKIDETLERIEKDLKLIETKKKEMLNKKEEDKPKNIEEKKEIKKQDEKKEEKKAKINDIIKAQQLILNNIMNQNKYFDDYMKKISKSTNKKRTILSSLSNFANVVLNFTVSLLPVSLFKNKLLGTLVSSIMINNSLKTMRRMLNPNLKVDYQLFIDNYYNSKNILYDTYQMCDSSLQELTLLKEELLSFDQNDIKNLLFQIELIENNIKNQMKKLNVKKETIEKVYVKIKNDKYII